MNPKTTPIPEPVPPPPRIWTTLDLINWTKAFFEKKGIEHPRLEAELLLAEALGCARIRLYVDFEKPIEAEKLAKFRDYVKRRGEKREPLQYILGHSQFIDLKIKVTPAALIPRPETELLAVWAVERARELLPPAPAAIPPAENPDAQPPAAPLETPAPKIIRVLDLCTGTGCVGLYVASKIPSAHVVSTDVSKDALALAAENALALKLDARVVIAEGDLFGALSACGETEPFDIIAANPPYIDDNDRATLQPEVRDFEPSKALFASDRGLAMVRRILTECDRWLKPGGHLGIEFGAGQSECVRECAESTGLFETLQIQIDGAKIPRFLFAKKRSA